MAVSFCGNHDNRGYNAGWGETYHGQLVVHKDSEAEVRDNYETASNQYYAKNLVGKLLLIHGTAAKRYAFTARWTLRGSFRLVPDNCFLLLPAGEMDENVHFSLSMKVANELIKENKDFDMLIVPNTDHSGVCSLFAPACVALPVVVMLPRLWLGQMTSAHENLVSSIVLRALGVRGPYAVRRMWDYFVTHLQGGTPPKEYEISGGGEQAVTH